MIVCFDIGGTAIKGGFAFSAEDLRPLPRRPTPVKNYQAFVETLRGVLLEAAEKPRCVAISIAGIVDPDTGIATIANIPCLHGRPVAADLEADLGLPVIIANDADCFTVAEAHNGAGRGHDIVFGAILGTGVGGGVVVDGKLVNRGGFAGEWGHGPLAATSAGSPPVEIPRFQCGCGLKGCIDTICGARGMERLHTHLSGAILTSEEIVEAWGAGDIAATRTIGALIDILASPLALVINVTGATIVPVGGGLANSKALLAEIDAAVRARILRRFDRPVVVQAICRPEPGLIGAALLGLEFSTRRGA